MNDVCKKILKKSQETLSPYELEEPPSTAKKIKKSKSTEFLLFSAQRRSKSKKDKYYKCWI